MNRSLHLGYRALLGGLLLIAMAAPLHALTPARGVFLVADEKLADPRFHDRVVLLIQHDEQGSAGLVVNRSSRLPLSAILPEPSQLAEADVTLSYGGPVEPQTLLALVQVRKHPPEPAEEVIDGVYVTGVGVLEGWPDFTSEAVRYRAFVGYTGWAPGQLNAEMERGDWHVLPADEESVFAGRDAELWARLSHRLASGQ